MHAWSCRSITVVYNNHAYGGPHSRVIEKTAEEDGAEAAVRARLSRQPDMNMAQIAKGLASTEKSPNRPSSSGRHSPRARKATVEASPISSTRSGAHGRRLGGQAVDPADQHRARAHQKV